MKHLLLCTLLGLISLAGTGQVYVQLGLNQPEEFKVEHLEDTFYCDGSFLTYNNLVEYPTYLWSTGDTTKTVFISAMDEGDHWVRVTNENNCSATDSFFVDIMFCDNLEELNGGLKLEIFPVPNEGRFTVNIKDYNIKVNLSILNNLGQVTHEMNDVSFPVDVDLKHLSIGMYVLQISEPDGSIFSRKFVIK